MRNMLRLSQDFRIVFRIDLLDNKKRNFCSCNILIINKINI